MSILNQLLLAIIYYLKNDWWILLIGSLIAVIIKVYIDPNKFKDYINKKSKTSIVGSVGFGALTPLCACGTMAVILAMFVTTMPFGPVMAFLVSSPLTGPSDYFFQASILGFQFANVVFITSIVLGLTAGFVAHYLEAYTPFFNNQFRFQKTCTDCKKEDIPHTESDSQPEHVFKRLKVKGFIKEFYQLGIKKVLLLFILFITISQLVEILIPDEIIFNLFSSEKSYSVLLAGVIGLPLYVSGPASLPLLKTLIENGAGGGAVLTFIITGKATGVPVILGMSSILKRRAMYFYVLFIFVTGIISGYIYNLFLSF